MKREALNVGDKVVCLCLEAETYKDNVWTVMSNPWSFYGEEVVLLKFMSEARVFSTKWLKKVE